MKLVRYVRNVMYSFMLVINTITVAQEWSAINKKNWKDDYYNSCWMSAHYVREQGNFKREWLHVKNNSPVTMTL